MRSLLMVAALTLAVRASAEPGATTYQTVVSGMSCKQRAGVSETGEGLGRLECNYRVGRSLQVVISGVGDKDAGIAFMESSFKGDFYASVGLLHGCVTVWTGEGNQNGNPLDLAFISPRDGKVYQDWVACSKAEPR